MYILFKMKPEQQLGAVQIYGRWLGYCVGFIPETHKDIIPYLHLDSTILEEATAKAWLLNEGWKGHVSIRPGTLEDEQMKLHESTEPTGEKEKYTLTDTDKTNAMNFMKAVMRKIVDEVYDHRLQALNVNASKLESSTWVKQRTELAEYRADNTATVPLLTALATSRGITLEAMATLVENAIADYDSKVNTLLANKQTTEKLIKDCASLKECFVLLHNKFEYTMPVALATELSVTDAAQFDV
jgi:hypothetical protein